MFACPTEWTIIAIARPCMNISPDILEVLMWSCQLGAPLENREKRTEDNKLSARHRLVSDRIKDLNAGQSPAPYIIVNKCHTRWSVFGQDGQFSSVPQVMSDTLWPHGLQHARLPCPSPTPGALLRLMSIDLVMLSNHLIYCCPLLLLPSIIPSIRVFSNESFLPIRWLKYWSFSFSISPSSEYSGLISFRMVWLDLFGVQGTLKSFLLQHHSSNASILQHSAFFIVQLSHPYMTTGKTIALTRWTFIGK